ncbi:MAG: sigma-70 family RNA polymerase sigma factor [Gemmataceae bacterium]
MLPPPPPGEFSVLTPDPHATDHWGKRLERHRAYLTLLGEMQLRRRFRVKVDPADLVQETFLLAWENRGQYRGQCEESLVGWLRAIFASQLAQLVRRFTQTQSRDLQREILMGFVDDSRQIALWTRSSASPSRQASVRETTRRVAEALGQLQPDAREVLYLHHFDGLSFPEIARQLNRTEGATTMIWVRALHQLQQILGDET